MAFLPRDARFAPAVARQHPAHIIILSRRLGFHTTQKLVETARRLGHSVRVLDPIHCLLHVVQGKPAVFYRGHRITKADVVIPRIGVSITDFGLAIVSQFEAMGIPVLNRAHAIACSRNKLHCLQLLAGSGIATPASVMVKNLGDLDKAVALVGGLPVIIKTLQGSQGIGVMLAESRAVARAILETMVVLNQPVIVQEYICNGHGADIRAIVVGGRVIAAMQRVAEKDDFRANVHRGGNGQSFTLSAEDRRLALAAVKTVGLDVAGVDILTSQHKSMVLEINSSPGIKAIAATTPTDIATAIIDTALSLVRRRPDRSTGEEMNIY